MITYIALFRGINVGGKNLLPMKELAPLLESNGYQNIRTYIQSGNVVFESSTSSTDLSKLDMPLLIENEFGFKPEITFLLKEDLINAFENCPYLSAEGNQCHFYFCTDMPTLDIEKLETLKTGSEDYFLKDKVFYLHAPDGIGRSKLVTNIERCLGVSATGRNLNTIRRLIAMTKTDSL